MPRLSSVSSSDWLYFALSGVEFLNQNLCIRLSKSVSLTLGNLYNASVLYREFDNCTFPFSEAFLARDTALRPLLF